MNEYHMKESHKIDIISYKTIWEEIKAFYKRKEKKDNKNPLSKTKRKMYINYWTEPLRNILTNLKEKLNNFI